ncbi:MAG: hypothetical protein M1834_002113 [Cirrosporium novae-zelandiae]|nr:MAG: hypothetical protein M1834_002113 [Cirrosporium novae-zelandiae]
MEVISLRRAPQCLSCLRRITTTRPTLEPLPPSLFRQQQQLRGKKKLAQAASASVKVRLLDNIEGYGRTGAILDIPRGLMRNKFLPTRKAEYMTATQLAAMDPDELELAQQAAHVERPEEKTDNAKDTNTNSFALPATPTPTLNHSKSTALEIKQQQLEPKRAAGLLSQVLPPVLSFPRAAIRAPSSDSSSSGPVPIYGSVSTIDIANSIKEILTSASTSASRSKKLTAQEQSLVLASRIQVSPEDISIVAAKRGRIEAAPVEDASRVKHLGEWDIEISIKGVLAPVKGKVRIVDE